MSVSAGFAADVPLAPTVPAAGVRPFPPTHAGCRENTTFLPESTTFSAGIGRGAPASISKKTVRESGTVPRPKTPIREVFTLVDRQGKAEAQPRVTPIP